MDIEAVRPLDTLYLDTWPHDGDKFLLAFDMFTLWGWCRTIKERDEGKWEEGRYTEKVHLEHQIIEASLLRKPTTLKVDREGALLTLPHNNVVGLAAEAHHRNLAERCIQDLANACRIHNKSPSEAIHFYNERRTYPDCFDESISRAKPPIAPPSNLNFASEPIPAARLEELEAEIAASTHSLYLSMSAEDFAWSSPVSIGDLCTWQGDWGEVKSCDVPGSLAALLVKPVQDRIADYDGRVFEENDFCVIKMGKRTKKSDLCYSKVCKVVERIGAKTYLVRKATGNVVTRPIEALKPYRMDNCLFDGARISRKFLERASRATWDVEVPEFDVAYAPGDFNANDNWTGKTVWLSFPFRERIPEALQAAATKPFAELWIALPDLQCEDWMATADAMTANDTEGFAWLGSGLGGDFFKDNNGVQHNEPVWVDRDGNRTASFPFSWWIGRFARGDT
jgi:hypothetical protein